MKILTIPVMAATVLAAAPAMAHHSAAMFDASKLVVLKGTVRSFSYVNPHSWISVDGAPIGQAGADRWDVEATSPGSLARIGVSATTLKSGDKVTVAIRPLRDGRKAGSMVFVTAADGKSYGAKPSDLGLNPDGSPAAAAPG